MTPEAAAPMPAPLRLRANPVRHFARCAACWAVLGCVLLVLPRVGVAQDPVTEKPSKVEAAFLRNFARYVTWPTRAFANERSPWTICIVGGEHFDDVLETTFQGRTEQGRSFEVFRAKTPDQLPSCQIVFIGYQSGSRRRATLDGLKNQPVLTVGNAPDFLSEGGIIKLEVADHVEMSINLDQARASSLVISTKMLEVSRDIVENGALRRWR